MKAAFRMFKTFVQMFSYHLPLALRKSPFVSCPWPLVQNHKNVHGDGDA